MFPIKHVHFFVMGRFVSFVSVRSENIELFICRIRGCCTGLFDIVRLSQCHRHKFGKCGLYKVATNRDTVYPKKYAHGFVVLCFVVVMQSFIMNSHEVFIHIHQGCFAGTGAIVRLPQCKTCAYFLGYTVQQEQDIAQTVYTILRIFVPLSKALLIFK